MEGHRLQARGRDEPKIGEWLGLVVQMQDRKTSREKVESGGVTE